MFCLLVLHFKHQSLPLLLELGFSSSSSSSFNFFSISHYSPSPVECPLSGPTKEGTSLTECCERNIIFFKWMTSWAAWGKTGSKSSEWVKNQSLSQKLINVWCSSAWLAIFFRIVDCTFLGLQIISNFICLVFGRKQIVCSEANFQLSPLCRCNGVC